MLDRLCRNTYISVMQVTNPLVPPPPGQSGAAPAPVANAPSAQDTTKRETSHPVTASRESEGGRNEAARQPDPPPSESSRGGNLDIQV